MVYKNHYVLIKKLNMFLGDHHENFICRRRLNSYTSENMSMMHKQKCGDDDITTIKLQMNHIFNGKKLFHKNPFYFRINTDFEADNEKDNSSIGDNTTIIYKQNPVLNGYRIESELEDVLKSRHYESPLGYDNVDWFVDEVIKVENKMTFYFKNTNKDIIMTKENEDYKNNNICRFCEKKILNLINVTQQVNIGAQLITLVILMKHKNKAILYHSYFTISVTMIFICFLRS